MSSHTGCTGPSHIPNECRCCPGDVGSTGTYRTAAGRLICKRQWPTQFTTPFTMSPPYINNTPGGAHLQCPTGTTCIQPTCCSGFSRGLGIYTRLQAGGRILPRTSNQNGRWNFSATNTKMFPITSYCKVNPTAIAHPKEGCRCITLSNGKAGCSQGAATRYSNLRPPDPYLITSVRQAKNIFVNTAYQMSKNEKIAYLSKNRAYLWR